MSLLAKTKHACQTSHENKPAFANLKPKSKGILDLSVKSTSNSLHSFPKLYCYNTRCHRTLPSTYMSMLRSRQNLEKLLCGCTPALNHCKHFGHYFFAKMLHVRIYFISPTGRQRVRCISSWEGPCQVVNVKVQASVLNNVGRLEAHSGCMC